ncbi:MULTISPECIES: TlpA disulfide reductase family protein [Ralstonia solanacearum species complex]|uniref:Redoxin family protein n=1 Tax=Ralstonia syzygii TaxID=28097 RepID=A0ABX7ZC53_9RALS|nr:MULTISPECIES: TlpA disulfide reductase family protein [Ralstonia solanacearum species complex]BEU70630.1 TlpA disulfide reductase family protein [Ralstonia pseudosolanacearum]AXV75670.1 alkyl hydroperoxide reductase [Ralstonia solanacearum]AXV89670.1 alkyl hydroperoxide reductase [Ralstonia solanacearum]AXW17876.1 alkyl hydroperoxide reductase [Ralstonia solanacearum]AXW74583.1 alkyl hydroperoxide reductase [Ralstonia solanacearum]
MRTVRRIRRWLAAVMVPMALAAGAARAVEVGDTVTLPDVQLLDGTRVPGEAWRGHPVIIATWASWCPYCALQNPRLQKLYDATRNTDLRLLTISIDANPQLAGDYVAKRGFTFPVTMESDALCAATGPRKGLPELLVLDADGRVVKKETGEMLEDDVADLARYAHGAKAPAR